MKHTNFYELVENIKQQEYNELMTAVKAHGGSYKWDDDDERPIIAVNANSCFPNPNDIEVCAISIVDGILKIDGVDKSEGYPIEFQTKDVFAGHLSYIIDYLPAIGRMDDVSSKTIPEDPWRCEECGSLNVDMKVWVGSNTGEQTAQDCVDRGDCWCYDCEEHTNQVQENDLIDTINYWFHNDLKPDDTEVISGLNSEDYATEEEYDQACNNHWESLSSEKRISIWKSLNYDKHA